MKYLAFIALFMTSACMPSQHAVFSPVDREVERRIGIGATWHASTDPAVPAAVRSLLDEPLDRDAVVRIALANNRRLQARYDELGIAASAIASATVLAPTEVELAHKLALDGEGGETEIDVIQDVLDLIQMPQRRGIAQAELAAARARAVAATVALAAAAEAAWIDVVAAKQQLELRDTAFEAASAATELVERMYAAGNATRLALARERGQREQARIELARAQLDVEVRREALNDALGLYGPDTEWTAVDRLPELPAAPPNLENLERDAITASLELIAARADAQAAAGRIGVARVRAWLPELGVGVSVARNDGEWEAGPAVSIGLPIFNQQQGPRARAHAELRRARNEAIAAATELRTRARATRQRVLEAHAEARHWVQAVLPLRQEVLDETLVQYNAMNASTLELLTARLELANAGTQYIDALRRFAVAEAEARALARGALTSLSSDERASIRTSTRQESH